MTRFSSRGGGRPEDRRAPRAPFSGRGLISEHSTPLSSLDAIGERFGIAHIIEQHTLELTGAGEVISIRSDTTDVRTGIMAYACAKALKKETADAVAGAIVSEAIAEKEQARQRHADAARRKQCVLGNPELTEGPIEAVKHGLSAQKPVIAATIGQLSALYSENGLDGLGLVEVHGLMEKLGLTKIPKLHVITPGTGVIKLDIRDTLSEEQKRILSELVGHITSASLSIETDVSQRAMTERPSVTFRIHVIGIRGMREGGPATTIARPDGTVVGQGRREQVANYEHFDPDAVAYPSLDKTKTYYAGSFTPDGFRVAEAGGCMDLSRLMPPKVTEPWMIGGRFALVFRENALIVADMGKTPLKSI